MCQPTAFVLAVAIAVGILHTAPLNRQAAAEALSMAVDDARAAASGIRRLDGRHLVLYTDLPASLAVDSLPALFDVAVPQWAAYFGIAPAATADWRVQGFLIGDRAKFASIGLLPTDNDLVHGYAKGTDLWLFDQPTDYYRRHLLLHEGTHAFMQKFLGGCGPGWYSEGMAELLATHRLEAGSREQRTGSEKERTKSPDPFVTLGSMPRDRREVPMLGRIKLVQDAVAAGRALRLDDVMKFDSGQQPDNEKYAWCWAAAKLLDSHSRYRARFRALQRHVADPAFNDRVRRAFAADWDELEAEWEAYVATLEHGYDFDRMAIQFRRGTPLDGERAVAIAADRGWQSSGVWLEAGTTYRIAARGRYQIAEQEGVAWPCEPGGITIEYRDGYPLGMLLGAIVEGRGGKAEGGRTRPHDASFARPLAIGLGCEFKPPVSGTLYLRVNDGAGQLGDNRGDLTSTIAD